jgi:hypothetical protein
MAKKAIVALVVVFVLYALVTDPRRSADLVRDVTRGILGGAQVVAESVLAFLDELV